MQITDWLSNSISFIGLIVIIIQLEIVRRTFKADHERRKKQATIEFINNIRPIWAENAKILDSKFGKNTLTSENIAELEEKPELRDVIKTLLGRLEHMSVGMNTGVFDKDLLYRMSSSYLIRIYRRLEPYIKYVQNNNSFAYIEFQDIISDFEERKRIKPDPRGNIRYS